MHDYRLGCLKLERPLLGWVLKRVFGYGCGSDSPCPDYVNAGISFHRVLIFLDLGDFFLVSWFWLFW